MAEVETAVDQQSGESAAVEMVGARLDDLYGGRVGQVVGSYIDPSTGTTIWLNVRLGRFGSDHVVVPFADAVAGAGHVFVSYERDQIRGAPGLALGAPITRELEQTLCGHYSMADRAAQLESRAHGEVTAVAVLPDEDGN